MVEARYSAVCLFTQAVESIGAAIETYLRRGPADSHLIARQIDTGTPCTA